MLHDALMLNEEQIRFTQEGNAFYRQFDDAPGRKKVFTAGFSVEAGDFKAAERALKEFVIWCYDRRLTPVRVSGSSPVG